jgi:hypothetical protein
MTPLLPEATAAGLPPPSDGDLRLFEVMASLGERERTAETFRPSSVSMTWRIASVSFENVSEPIPVFRLIPP